MKSNNELRKLEEKYTNFNLKPYYKYGYLKEEILKMKEAFDLFDINRKGILDINELKDNLNRMGMCSKNDDIEKLKDEGVNQLDFLAFINLLAAKNSCKSNDEVKKLYKMFLNSDDISEDLTIDNFKKIANELELQLADNEIYEMMMSINPKNEGYISYEEFYNVMMKIYN